MKKISEVCLLLIVSCFCRGQHAIVVAGHPVNYDVHEGSLTYIDGQTIQGSFLYGYWEFPTVNIQLLDSTKNHVQKRIYAKNIQEVVLAGHDTAFSNLDSTWFKKIDEKRRLYRQLSFGETKIFDDLFSVDENPGRLGSEFIIIQDSVIRHVSEQRNLIKALSKLPKPLTIEKGQTVQDIIRKLNT